MAPEGFDPIYFRDDSWAERVQAWQQRPEGAAFSNGNQGVIDQLLDDPDAGLRVVINIGTAELLMVLSDGVYKNRYQEPIVGGVAKGAASERRVQVDTEFDTGIDTFYCAVALGGAGVGYYGENCMVLRPSAVPARTGLVDRDSYQFFEPPFDDELRSLLKDRLTGDWTPDVEAMVKMKVLPDLDHDRRLATSGTISEFVLRDQEFIEVHLKQPFGPDELEEVRESPDEVAIEARIGDKKQKRRHVTAVEHEWLRRRDRLASELNRANVRARVVTTHGRGHRWA